MLAGFEHSLFAGFSDLVFDFFFCLLNAFFNARGVDTAVGDELFNGQTGDFTAYRIKSRNDDGFRRIINDEINARRRFKGADIAALAADDAALHIVIGQIDNGNCRFSHMVSRATLNRQRDDITGFLFALFLGLAFNVADHGSGVMISFFLNAVHHHLAGFILRERCDALQLGKLFGL